MRVAAVLLLSIALASQALGQDQPAPEVVARACKAVEKLPVPPNATTAPPKDKNGEPCDPLVLYYGTHGRPDYLAARRCALAEWNNPSVGNDEGQIAPYAQAALVMIYANGAGVPRDVDHAMRVACANPFTGDGQDRDELSLMVAALLKAKVNPRARFDYCRQAAGFYTWKLECDWIEQGVAESRHKAPLVLAMRSWTPLQRSAYASMMKARSAFVEQQAGINADAGCGTGAGGIVMDAESQLRVEMLDTMMRYESGHLPHFSSNDYSAADKVLNETYASTIASLPPPDECTLSAKDYQDAERAWLAYRDAWVAFAKVRWPQVPAVSWMAELTRERVKELENKD